MTKCIMLCIVFLLSSCATFEAPPVYVGDTLPTITYDVGTGQIYTIDPGFTEDGFGVLNQELLRFETQRAERIFTIMERVGILRADPVTFTRIVPRQTVSLLQATVWDDRGDVLAARAVVFESTGRAFEIGNALASALRGGPEMTSSSVVSPAEMKVIMVANTDHGVFISVRWASSDHAVAALVTNVIEAEAFVKNAYLGAEDEFGRPVSNFYIQ